MNFNNTLVPNFAYRLGASYITGSHAFKVGFNRTHGFLQNTQYNFQPFQYRFNNGIPNQITLYPTPIVTQANEDNDLGLFVQDRWTMSRMTVNAAIRYDYFGTSFPEQIEGPGTLLPNRNIVFAAQDNLKWKDVTYRMGLVYDVRGNGKTAIKFTANKYLLGQTLNALGSTPNPVTTTGVGVQATRSWNDRGGLGINGDYVPQCNLLNPAANGECGPTTPNTFGQAGAIVNVFDPDLLGGFGHRQYNWEFTAGVQHEILPRVSIDVGWFRRIWGNFPVVDNTQISAADFTQFSLKVPVDPRLPNGGGYTVTGLYDLIPSAFGRTLNNNTLSDKLGNQIEHWNGYEVAINARPRNGLSMQLAFGSAKQIEDNCAVVATAPEVLNTGGPAVWRPASYCHRESPFLTQIKAYGIYTVPKIAVQIAGTLRSTPGAAYNANFTATSAYLAANSTLGRSLSAGSAATMSVNLIQEQTQYLDRRNELDLRFGKVLKTGKLRSVISLDLYNTLNTNTPISANSSFSLSTAGTVSWLAPTEILNPRLAKISFQLDF